MVGRAHKEFSESSISAVRWDTVANYELAELERRAKEADIQGAEGAQMLHELVEQARTMQVQGIEKVKKLHEEVVKREKEKGDAKEHFHNLVAEKEVCNHLLRNCLTLLSRAHETRTQARAGRLHARAPSYLPV